MSQTSSSLERERASEDLYRLTAEDIKEPPSGWRQSFRYFGPGLVLSAAVVGSGELIATTALGAQAGFVLLWLVVFSTVVKLAVQIELARWCIATGEPALTGLNRLRPKVGRIGWVNLVWVTAALAKFIQLGGVVGGVVAACSILAPINGDPLSFTSTLVWTIIVVTITVSLQYSTRYNRIERVAVFLVALFSLAIVVVSFGLVPFTPYAYTGDDILGGLGFELPLGSVGAAIAMFGITGIGGDEMTNYTYWCLEKGYARWAGPDDGSEAWRKRADGWIKVMYKDACVSWVVYTFGTIAFFMLGAAVLAPQGIVPKGNDMIVALSRVFTDTLGDWASVVFLVGAVIVLGSTMWASTASNPRQYTNFLGVVGAIDWNDPKARLRWIRAFTVGLPIFWGISYLLLESPVLMVQIGGIASAIFLVALVVAVWHLHNKEIDRRLHGGRAFNAALAISSAAVMLLGVYALLEVFGVSLG
ncbi:Nramp family divalent metal transporter [Haloactinomyces albus]|uniref:Mn2+/Fe2+ NRAMP family transporter n=1 Tax=Haloactinomyces albus TaxID=1352928 RepID=A0AAE3ZHB5_9ACTN|nr:Nramp family divalent metal transporter [Haloactinomyces albus]MDR7304020.1 Mn2+/Fe2+ NRAMP family transporter [Haloactinomyces albus]